MMTWHPPVNLVKSRVPVRILYTVLYFTDQHLAPLYRLFCKIANLWDIDLKFSGFICDVNSDNPAKFREVSMPRSCISKNRVFGILVCNLQTSQVKSKNFFWFRASSLSLTSGTNFMVIPPVVSEILGGVVPPPRCQFTVKKSRCY